MGFGCIAERYSTRTEFFFSTLCSRGGEGVADRFMAKCKAEEDTAGEKRAIERDVKVSLSATGTIDGKSPANSTGTGSRIVAREAVFSVALVLRVAIGLFCFSYIFVSFFLRLFLFIYLFTFELALPHLCRGFCFLALVYIPSLTLFRFFYCFSRRFRFFFFFSSPFSLFLQYQTEQTKLTAV